MQAAVSTRRYEALMLVARIMMMMLFVPSGWEKLTHFNATVAEMTSTGLSVPVLATIVAIVMELLVGTAITLGVLTRPLAGLLALFTLAAGFIGHHYWSETGDLGIDDQIHFYKNIAIMGGLLLLCATGPGCYSIDAYLRTGVRRRMIGQ